MSTALSSRLAQVEALLDADEALIQRNSLTDEELERLPTLDDALRRGVPYDEVIALPVGESESLKVWVAQHAPNDLN